MAKEDTRRVAQGRERRGATAAQSPLSTTYRPPIWLRVTVCGLVFFGMLTGAATAQVQAPLQDKYSRSLLEEWSERQGHMTNFARSVSGQFIVNADSPAPALAPPLSLLTNQHFLSLKPSLLSVSSERIKQVLYRELGASAPWRGRIYLALFPAAGPDEPITITSERFRDGWQYRVDLPDPVERTHYVRAMVQVLLQEMANRDAGERSGELPSWLIEGLARQLLISSELEILLPPPNQSVNGLSINYTRVNARRDNPLEKAHQQLRLHLPLTFEELSWPGEEQLYGADAEVYRSSAQLFVTELLRLNDGPARLRGMLAELPNFYNWQFAFLSAFRSSFPSLLDIEKWWAVHVVDFTGRDLAQTWPLPESWQKLDQILHAPVEVRVGTNDLPLHAEVPLQTIIREWDHPRQTAALHARLIELEFLRLRVAEDLLMLVGQYRQTIESYLRERDRTGFLFPFLKKVAVARATAETLRQLDSLDVRREALRPAPKPVASARAQPSVSP